MVVEKVFLQPSRSVLSKTGSDFVRTMQMFAAETGAESGGGFMSGFMSELQSWGEFESRSAVVVYKGLLFFFISLCS